MDLMKKHQKRRIGWSKLSPDILRKIFETLSPIDSHQAKTVCSDWYSIWKTCLNLPPCPLRIIHQGHSSTLFCPKAEEARKFLVDGVPYKDYCMASSESWLFMVDYRLDFHLFNLLTRERINLPSMNLPIRGGQVRFQGGRSGYLFFGPSNRKDYISKDILQWKNSAVLWVNEKTGDYVVAWVFRQHYLFSYKKGDDSWSSLNVRDNTSGFVDVAFKNNKLYVFTTRNRIRIFNFSQDFPKEEKTKNPYRHHPFRFDEQPWEYIWKRKIAIDKSGEVLIILSLKDVNEEKLMFYIFKMNRESCKWERVYSIGDEMLIFGHGVTVKAPVKDLGDGIKSDSIYFVEEDVWPDHQDHDRRASDCGVFDIATSRIEWPKKVCFYLNSTQWFVPGVAY